MKVFENIIMILIFGYMLWPIWLIMGIGAYVAYLGFKVGAVLEPSLMLGLLVFLVYLIVGYRKESTNESIH